MGYGEMDVDEARHISVRSVKISNVPTNFANVDGSINSEYSELEQELLGNASSFIDVDNRC